ncbi:MAG TPA: tungstate ABC transporter substrate-binding protein WtpA [Stellaceae bacterium]|nr:tungstate ABC transporter substrate-binding protein WtpA [Stellaceae bacterium]
MTHPVRAFALIGCILLLVAGSGDAAERQTLTIFAAGTLAVPFKALDENFQRQHPSVTVQPIFGGSVMMAKRLTELHQPADLIAVADYSVIPKYLYGQGGAPRYADWFIGFARNAVTFVYTDKSKYAAEITPANWYRVLARPGVEIGRSDPDTDPSGYQTVQMLNLAEKFYDSPGLAARILANAPRTNMRDTETALISALELGQIDYLAIYRSDALQHHFHHLDLPAKIDLSDANEATFYATGVAHTKNGDLRGKPIVYAVTIPRNAEHRDLAEAYLQLLLGPEGQAVIAGNGFGAITPAYVANQDAVPAPLRAELTPWPGS